MLDFFYCSLGYLGFFLRFVYFEFLDFWFFILFRRLFFNVFVGYGFSILMWWYFQGDSFFLFVDLFLLVLVILFKNIFWGDKIIFKYVLDVYFVEVWFIYRMEIYFINCFFN